MDSRKILAVIMLASFLTPFSGSALILSLPAIGQEYQVGADTLSWVIESYLITSFLFLLPMGRAADRWGKVRVFEMGNLLFMLFSLLPAVFDSFALLLSARALQGIGSSMIFATSTSILADAYPGKNRGKAMGWMVSVVYAGLSFGPVIGGFMNDGLGWRSLFWFMALYAGLVLVVALKVLKHMAGAAAPAREMPKLSVSLFTENREFTLSCLTAMLNYSATFAISFLLSLYLQSILSISAKTTGFILLAQPVLMMLLSPLAGSLSDRKPAAVLCSLGMAIITVGLIALTLITHAQVLWPVIPSILVIGIGFAFFAAPNNNAIMSSLPRKYYNMASSLLSTMRLGGQVLSMALVTVIMAIAWPELAPRDALTRNITAAFLLFSVLCFLGVIPSLLRGKAAGSGEGK
ncbi:Predicted arabinose efflux permease, MFS family [Selenomonas sp. GACV-9]|uniref:MFS transporter n=1 Tax=Selenomonas sp. GACV-9 TaxID=3158782 RepID=UPI0008E8C802|nr:Predicted arabinose efflux permease, MFS family [Selenomonas ruminantium]